MSNAEKVYDKLEQALEKFSASLDDYQAVRQAGDTMEAERILFTEKRMADEISDIVDELVTCDFEVADDEDDGLVTMITRLSQIGQVMDEYEKMCEAGNEIETHRLKKQLAELEHKD